MEEYPIITREKCHVEKIVDGRRVILEEIVTMDYGKGGKTTSEVYTVVGMHIDTQAINNILRPRGLELALPERV